MKGGVTVDFDERIIERWHVELAIKRYLKERPKHHPAQSAFLPHEGEKLPAKFLLRLAFEEATGAHPKPETLTGGKASVRVLQNLGFEAVYDKPPAHSGKRNPIKSARREALKAILEERYGPVEREWKTSEIVVPDLEDRAGMGVDLRQVLEVVEGHRGQTVKGRKNHKLAFDLFVAKLRLPIEYDERQHFTPLRAAALRRYPQGTVLGFDRERWISLSETIRAGDNSPAYRDEQRAFYDAIRDIRAPQVNLLPVIRIFEEDVAWDTEGAGSPAAKRVLREIEAVVQIRTRSR